MRWVRERGDMDRRVRDIVDRPTRSQVTVAGRPLGLMTSGRRTALTDIVMIPGLGYPEMLFHWMRELSKWTHPTLLDGGDGAVNVPPPVNRRSPVSPRRPPTGYDATTDRHRFSWATPRALRRPSGVPLPCLTKSRPSCSRGPRWSLRLAAGPV